MQRPANGEICRPRYGREGLRTKIQRLDLRQRAELQPRGVGANAVDHGANAVRALWRQVLLEAEAAKGAMRVDGKDLFRRSIGKKRDRDRDQTAHEVGIAVPAIAQGRPAVAIRRSARIPAKPG